MVLVPPVMLAGMALTRKLRSLWFPFTHTTARHIFEEDIKDAFLTASSQRARPAHRDGRAVAGPPALVGYFSVKETKDCNAENASHLAYGVLQSQVRAPLISRKED
jgi:hypothetical protein